MAAPRPLRILCVTSIFPPDIGGPATYLARLAQALVGRGHRVIVLTLSDRPGGDDGFPFPVVRLSRHTFRPRRWSQTVRRVIGLGREADVLFVHGLALEAVAANLIIRRPLVHKVVGDLIWERAVLRGWVSDGFQTFQRRRYGPGIEALRALRTWWSKRAARVIVPSHYLKHWVAEWGVPEEHLVVVPNAVEPPEALPPVGLRLPTRVRVVSVGRLVPWKRVDGILRSAAALDGVGLVVVGEGPERSRLETLAATLGITDRVVFAGQRTRGETFSLMAACDIFVLNSTYEGLPHVVLEAMSLGLAVIATDAGGTRELIAPGEDSILLPPDDPEALTAALARLAGSPEERSRLGARARASAARFSFGALVEATERVLVESAIMRSGR